MPLPEKFLHSGRHLAGAREKGAGVTGGGFGASRTDLSPHLPIICLTLWETENRFLGNFTLVEIPLIYLFCLISLQKLLVSST